MQIQFRPDCAKSKYGREMFSTSPQLVWMMGPSSSGIVRHPQGQKAEGP